MKTIISLLVTIVAFGYVEAQDIQYVNAENGLIVREKPSQGAIKVGMLDYGTAIEITEHTNLKLDVVDGGTKLTGEWVKVRGIDAYEFFEEGYVFNGYLTEEKLEKRFKTTYDEFTVTIEGVTEKERIKGEINPDFNGVLFFKLNDNETLEGKTVRVKHHQEFRTIEVFQKHENSIAISDDKSHCDIINWQHYYSSWKPLKTISSNKKFEALPISEKEASRFIDVNIEELKTVVNDACGETWSDAIKDAASLNDYPTKVVVSKLYLRILMTDIDGYKTEKIIIFEVPLNSQTKKESYAKL
ncbi:SH3 domain-containing protein [Pontimicrobium sp. SW4]|uniref:SH3 domain-containing protein n=1 Tax=Pontimicrobium sp. SW4 TaxID=3153519 RepID=A0AAU7BSN1_9FLAO